MSDFLPAVEKTLAHEGGFVQVAATGEVANYGLTHWFMRSRRGSTQLHSEPASPDEIEVLKDLDEYTAKVIYKDAFWDKQHCGDIRDQALAEKFFDLSVNMGPGQAAKLLQRAVNTQGWPDIHVAEDGAVGPKTIEAVNRCPASILLCDFQGLAAKFYRDLAASKPVLAKNLTGWLARVNS